MIGGRFSLVVCRSPGCPWRGVRFPLYGVDPDEPGIFVCDGGCGMPMRREWGEPHPVSVLTYILEARRNGDEPHVC